MDAKLAGVGIVAIVLIVFFVRFAGKGKFKFKSFFGSVSAEGENPPPPASVASGVRMSGVEAGKNVRATSTAEGGVAMEKVKAKGSVEGAHTPGAPPPKT